MSIPKIGARVEVVFDDHSEGTMSQRFRLYGILAPKDSDKITVNSWC